MWLIKLHEKIRNTFHGLAGRAEQGRLASILRMVEYHTAVYDAAELAKQRAVVEMQKLKELV